MQARNHLPCQHYNVVIDNSTAITSASVRTWTPPVYTPATTTATTTANTIGTAVWSAGVATAEVMLAIIYVVLPAMLFFFTCDN
jgi:hypothetical protein